VYRTPSRSAADLGTLTPFFLAEAAPAWFLSALRLPHANLQNIDGRSKMGGDFSSILQVDSSVSPEKSSNIHAIY
jgi:hypothetical protein